MTTDPQERPKLPNLPGYQVKLPPSAEGAPCKKPQTLYFRNGYAVVVPNPTGRSNGSRSSGHNQSSASAPEHQTKFDLATEPLASSSSHSGQISLSETPLPGWIKHAGQVLRFSAYFTEEVPYSPAEPWRVRFVNILHYLEDGTTQVTEQRDKSGDRITSGFLVKRSRIPVNATDAGAQNTNEFEAPPALGPANFAVGGTVTIHGRKLTILDGDEFTRNYMEAAGVPLGLAISAPVNPYEEQKARRSQLSGLNRSDPQSPTRFAEILMGRSPGTKKLQQFLEGNSKVLRFLAVWDDVAGARPGASPVRRPYKILYYLEDDTVEISELKEGNGGREFYRFLARAPLPKRQGCVPLGNTLSSEECVAPADLRIGGTVEVHGRVFFIHNADEFTKQWCVEHLGWGPEEVTAVDISQPAQAPRARELPPYNGYGTPEDSAYNCNRLIPAAPKPERRELVAESTNANCAALRFAARLVSRPGRPQLTAADRARRFALSFFLADGTIAIYEPPVPNSGIVGGKYLERCKAYKAGGERIAEQDLWVGATVEIYSRLFELTDADEWTLKTMEHNRKLFPKADGAAVLQTIQAAGNGAAAEAIQQATQGLFDQEKFWEAVQGVVPGVSKHEAIAALRQLRAAGTAAK